jgi:hypothetical protein
VEDVEDSSHSPGYSQAEPRGRCSGLPGLSSGCTDARAVCVCVCVCACMQEVACVSGEQGAECGMRGRHAWDANNRDPREVWGVKEALAQGPDGGLP